VSDPHHHVSGDGPEGGSPDTQAHLATHLPKGTRERWHVCSTHHSPRSSSIAVCLSAHCELGLLKHRTTPLGALRPPGTDPLTSCDGRGPHFEPPAWWRKRPAFRTRSASRHRRDHLELAAPLGTVGPDPRSPPTPFSAEGYFRSCCTACTALRTRFSAAADTPLGVAGHPEGPADHWPCARTGEVVNLWTTTGRRAGQPKLRHAIPCCCPASRWASRGRPLTAPRRTWATIQGPAASGLHIPLHGIVGLQVSLFLLTLASSVI